MLKKTKNEKYFDFILYEKQTASCPLDDDIVCVGEFDCSAR